MPPPPPLPPGTVSVGTIQGVWHKASVLDCLPLAAPIGLSPLIILTLCGSERLFRGWGGVATRKSRSALHIHVLVCICSNVRQFVIQSSLTDHTIDHTTYLGVGGGGAECRDVRPS